MPSRNIGRRNYGRRTARLVTQRNARMGQLRRFRQRIYRGSLYANTVHKFRQRAVLGTLLVPTSSVTGYVGAAQQFKLTDLPQSASFTVLFDQYSIDNVRWEIVYRGTQISAVESSNNTQIGMPSMIWVRDYDDATAPASSLTGWNEIQEYSKSKRFDFTGEKHCKAIRIKPAVLQAAYDTAISTAYAPKWGMHVDCINNAVPYYGIRYVMRVPSTIGTTLGVNFTFDIYATYDVSFYNVR